MSDITTFEKLDHAIQKPGGKPVLLEALWDGDTTGWHLCLFTSVKSGVFNKSISRHFIGRVFLNGKNRDEALLAKELGEKAAKKYDLEFYFPSPNEPDDDCPEWTERHLAINCQSCDKLIIPTTSPYLPKHICYNCHLLQEQNKKLINNEPIQDGIILYLSNSDRTEKIGFYGGYEYLFLSKFNIPNLFESDENEFIKVLILKNEELLKLKDNIEKALDSKLGEYIAPEINENEQRFSKSIYEVEYNDVKYTLESRRNKDHSYILESITALKHITRALAENYNLNICFSHGFKYQQDSILRYINYVKGGITNIDEIKEHYKKLLSIEDILKTIEELSAYECLTFDGFNISITPLGQNIV
jgi:hypothetical protein